MKKLHPNVVHFIAHLSIIYGHQVLPKAHPSLIDHHHLPLRLQFKAT